jgi:hypothetical protein
MKIEVLDAGSQIVVVQIGDPLPGVPQQMDIMPASKSNPIQTVPHDHYFSASHADSGPPRSIVDAARRFLAHEIDDATAGSLIDAALTEWSRRASR